MTYYSNLEKNKKQFSKKVWPLLVPNDKQQNLGISLTTHPDKINQDPLAYSLWMQFGSGTPENTWATSFLREKGINEAWDIRHFVYRDIEDMVKDVKCQKTCALVLNSILPFINHQMSSGYTTASLFSLG
jgi:hypothetical protein